MTFFGPLQMRLRSFRIVCGVLGAACVVLISSGAYLASEWNKSTSVGVDDVLTDFRSGTPTTAPVTDPAGAAVDAPAAEAPATTVAPTATDPGDAPAPGSAPATTTPTTAPAGPAGFTRPAEGVYAYRASGGETLSIGGARHDYPSEVFAIVRHTTCGYRLEVQVLQEHVDTTEVCIDGSRLSLRSFTQRLTFFGQTDAGEFACAPPAVLIDLAAGPGSSQPTDCTAAALQSTGTSTFERSEPTSIDGTTVTGHHVEWRWDASGKATGSGSARWTFDDSGLPLRIERENSTQSQSVLGPATHAESASFVLQSRSPRR